MGFSRQENWSGLPCPPNVSAAAKLLQLCPTLCDPVDGIPPGSPVPGILQARTLEWVAISFFSAWKWKVKMEPLSCVRLLATPWTAAYQAPLSMGFPRQEYWSGLLLPSPPNISRLPQRQFLQLFSFTLYTFYFLVSFMPYNCWKLDS